MNVLSHIMNKFGYDSNSYCEMDNSSLLDEILKQHRPNTFLNSFNIRIGYHDDGYYRGTVDELPDIEEFGDTKTDVYELLVDSIITTATIIKEKNQLIKSLRKLLD